MLPACECALPPRHRARCELMVQLRSVERRDPSRAAGAFAQDERKRVTLAAETTWAPGSIASGARMLKRHSSVYLARDPSRAAGAFAQDDRKGVTLVAESARAPGSIASGVRMLKRRSSVRLARDPSRAAGAFAQDDRKG